MRSREWKFPLPLLDSDEDVEEILERDDGENVGFNGGGDFVPFGMLLLFGLKKKRRLLMQTCLEGMN